MTGTPRLPCLLALLLSLCPAVAAARPPEPGDYCLKQEVEDLGNFLMGLSVRKSGSRYAVSFYVQMPDTQATLAGETENARVLSDGSFAFRFHDGWGNLGRARVWPGGRVDLVMIRSGPANSMGRNYGTRFLSRAACSAPEFAGQG